MVRGREKKLHFLSFVSLFGSLLAAFVSDALSSPHFQTTARKATVQKPHFFVLLHAVLPTNANFLQKTIAKRDKVCYNTVIKN